MSSPHPIFTLEPEPAIDPHGEADFQHAVDEEEVVQLGRDHVAGMTHVT